MDVRTSEMYAIATEHLGTAASAVRRAKLGSFGRGKMRSDGHRDDGATRRPGRGFSNHRARWQRT
jgi:hypothetical protein